MNQSSYFLYDMRELSCDYLYFILVWNFFDSVDEPGPIYPLDLVVAILYRSEAPLQQCVPFIS